MTAAQREADTIANTVLALADDYLAAHPDGIETDEVHDWLIAQAAAIRTTAAITHRTDNLTHTRIEEP